MTMTRSATSATTPMSWVMKITAMCISSCSRRISSRICAWMVTSSAVVGSSAMSSARLARQRHGDHHPLPHATRELVRIAAEHLRRFGDAHLLEHPQRLALRGARSSFR